MHMRKAYGVFTTAGQNNSQHTMDQSHERIESSPIPAVN